MNQLNINYLRNILKEIQETNYTDVQSIEKLMEYGFKLKQYMSYSGEQMSVAKEQLHKSRRQAMINLVSSLKANSTSVSAILQRQYVDDCCSKENADYELADRCNKTCTHSISLIVTCISALKEQMKMTGVFD